MPIGPWHAGQRQSFGAVEDVISASRGVHAEVDAAPGGCRLVLDPGDRLTVPSRPFPATDQPRDTRGGTSGMRIEQHPCHPYHPWLNSGLMRPCVAYGMSK